MKFSITGLRSVTLGLLVAATLAGCSSGTSSENTIDVETPAAGPSTEETGTSFVRHETAPSSDDSVTANKSSAADLPTSDVPPSPSETPAAAENPPANAETPPSGGPDLSGIHFQLPPSDKDDSLGSQWKNLLPAALKTSGLYVASDSKPLTDPNGANPPQRCNPVPMSAGDSGRVMTALDVRMGDYVQSVNGGCEGVNETEDPDGAPDMMATTNAPESTSELVQAPQGFVLSGYAVRTCAYDGHKVLAGLRPLGKRIEAWGVNDGIEWQGPKIQNPSLKISLPNEQCSDWVYERCEDGAVLTGITGKTSAFKSAFVNPLTGTAPKFLESVFGICQAVKSRTQSMPTVANVTIERSKTYFGLGENICKRFCPQDSIVAGVRYNYGEDDFSKNGKDKRITSITLLCRNLKDNKISEAEGGSCPKGLSLKGTEENPDQHPDKIALFPGFGAHAVHQGTKATSDKTTSVNIIDSLRFDQTPVDFYRDGVVWTGDKGEYSFPSAAAGREGSSEQTLSCPSDQVVTGMSFLLIDVGDPDEDVGAYLKLHRIGDIECAKVNVDRQ